MSRTAPLTYLGDAALAVAASEDDLLVANARVHRVAAAVRSAEVPGVRDVVPGMRDLVVHVDPLRCDLARLEALLHDAMDAPVPHDAAGACIDIPIVYGGDDGPDLSAVAEACGLTVEEVCRRHADREYVVCFIGFLPGFPYLAPLDPALRLPRRTTPRPLVPAGAVAIAGEYAGIYPWASPGGWHLIGRTDISLFDVAAQPPARLVPGQRVRFVPQ